MDNTNKEQQDPQLSGAADPNAMLENYESPILKDYDLMIEYKGLRDSAPSGVYVVPSFSSLRVWHGFIIVHQGWYKDGTFKFRIEFPDDYPEVQPTVKFLTKLYHPFVHQRTLEMHLGWAVKRWNPAKHSILYVLKRLKKMFYVDDFAKYPAVWEPAKKLSLANKQQFIQKARASAEASLKPAQLFQAPTEPGTSVKFTNPHPAHATFFENYLKSRGLERPGANVQAPVTVSNTPLKGSATATVAAESESVNTEAGGANKTVDDADLQDAQTNQPNNQPGGAAKKPTTTTTTEGDDPSGKEGTGTATNNTAEAAPQLPQPEGNTTDSISASTNAGTVTQEESTTATTSAGD